MARVIATGPAPASRAARIGGAFGQGLNVGALGGLEQFQQEQQMQEQADPIRAALTSILQQQGALGPGGLEQVASSAVSNPLAFALQGGGGQGTTPPAQMPPQPTTPPAAPQPTGQGTQQQQLLARIQQDPAAFARLFADQGIEGVMGMAAPADQGEPQSQTVVLSGEDPRGAQLGLRPGERARVKGVATPEGQFRPMEVLGTFGGSGGAGDTKPARILSGDTPEGQELGIPAGEFARVEGTLREDGGFQPERVVGRFAVGQEGPPDSMFGSGLTGRTLEMMTNMAPQFARNELSEDEERAFMSAVTQFQQPQQFTDPDTGLVETRRPELPAFVQDALKARGVTLGEDQAPRVPAPEQLQPGTAAPTGEEAGALDLQAQTQAINEQPTVTHDAIIPDMSDIVAEENRTLFHEIAEGNVTGPVPWIKRGLARIPGLGFRAREETEAGTAVGLFNLRLVKSLQQNPRFAVAERSDILERLQLDPSMLDTPGALIDRLVGVDKTLEQIEDEMEAVVNGDRELVPRETAQHAMSTLQAVKHYRSLMMPPRTDTRREATEFVENNPSGTQFVAQDDDGQWRIFEVE